MVSTHRPRESSDFLLSFREGASAFPDIEAANGVSGQRNGIFGTCLAKKLGETEAVLRPSVALPGWDCCGFVNRALTHPATTFCPPGKEGAVVALVKTLSTY